jgi:beta-galactosidase
MSTTQNRPAGAFAGLPDDVRARGACAYRELYATEMQRRLRDEAASFHAVVYWRPGCRDVGELERNFRIIADAGFDSVRCHNFLVEYRDDGTLDYSIPDAWLEAAIRAGVRIVLHLTSQRTPDDRALAQVGLTRAELDALAPSDPRFREALSVLLAPPVERYRDAQALLAWGGFGEPGATRLNLETEADGALFADWLRERYESVEALDAAWNIYPEAGPIVTSFDDAWLVARLPEGRTSINGASNAKINYGAQRDRYRFMADLNLQRTAVAVEIIKEIDAEHPVLTGSHQLFLNQPSLGWDIARWARLGDLHFSSIHMSWHFQPVYGEVDRPVYFQARQTRDYFKGGWTSAFETTGGPVQFSGGYGNHMDAGLMRRLCLSYLAAGNQNLAFWTWNHRPGGWEGGEYGMTSLSGRVTEWGREAGRIATAARKYAHELWSAEPGADVGLIQSWNTDVVQLFEPQRHDLAEGLGELSRGTKLCHSRSWIGYSRALVNNQISWHYVLEDELATDVVYSYPVLIAPFMRAISDETIDRLGAYVEAGGVLLADVAFGYYDQWGKLRGVGEGSAIDRLFGAWIDQVHDNRTGTRELAGERIPGFYGDLVTTSARPILRYGNGDVAASLARRGRGAALLVGFDAGTFCFEPGNDGFERIVERLVRPFAPKAYESNVPLTMRLRAQKADHYFIVNDGPEQDAVITTLDDSYRSGIDVLTDEPIEAAPVLSVRVPARSGAWIRLERDGNNTKQKEQR